MILVCLGEYCTSFRFVAVPRTISTRCLLGLLGLLPSAGGSADATAVGMLGDAVGDAVVGIE